MSFHIEKTFENLLTASAYLRRIKNVKSPHVALATYQIDLPEKIAKVTNFFKRYY